MATAVSGRSWLIREPISRVSRMVISNAHPVEKKLKPMPSWRSTATTTRNTTIPTPQATYRARQGNVALGGPSQTASTR